MLAGDQRPVTDAAEVNMNNFVVSVWEPADDGTVTEDLRGVVRHVATGTETPFHNDEEVLRLLHQPAAGQPQAADPEQEGRQPQAPRRPPR